MYTYTCRCLNKHPSGQVVMETIKEIRNTERCVATKNDNIEKHNNR